MLLTSHVVMDTIMTTRSESVLAVNKGSQPTFCDFQTREDKCKLLLPELMHSLFLDNLVCSNFFLLNLELICAQIHCLGSLSLLA